MKVFDKGLTLPTDLDLEANPKELLPDEPDLEVDNDPKELLPDEADLEDDNDPKELLPDEADPKLLEEVLLLNSSLDFFIGFTTDLFL